MSGHAKSVAEAGKQKRRKSFQDDVGQARPEVYTHLTMATDSKQMEFVLDACKMIFLGAHLAESGMTMWEDEDDNNN